MRVVTSRLQQARNMTVFVGKPPTRPRSRWNSKKVGYGDEKRIVLVLDRMQWIALRTMFILQSNLFRIDKYLVSYRSHILM